MSCPFCSPCLETQHVVTLRNDYCYFIHHRTPDSVLADAGLVIPIVHRETVFDLTPDEWKATYCLLHDAREWIEQRSNPSGYTLGWNCGAVGGQSVFHAHFHVIPRHYDEPHAGKGLRHWLKQPENRRPGML